MRNSLRLALLASFVPLAGCMTSGTNMHGDFACRAPNGTCAPMSVIDGKAVAGMGATAQPVGGIVDPAMPREGRVVTASADGTPPGRTADRVLRVVFPAHIDASGIYHDEASAHAVVERGAWTDGLTGGARQSPVTVASIADRGTSERLPSSRLASLDEVIAARAAQIRSGTIVVPASVPPPVTGFAPDIRTPVSLRSPSAIDLREAAAAATAGPVSELDPNFDTPDVSAVETAETAPSAGTCLGYHMVRWHGHSYRRPMNVPCHPVTAAVAPAYPAVAGPAIPGTTAALVHASIEQTPPPIAVAAATPSNVPSSSTAPANPPSATVASAVSPSSTAPVAPHFAPTSDPRVAAARVSAMATPITAEQVRLGRADAKAHAPTAGALLAGASATGEVRP